MGESDGDRDSINPILKNEKNHVIKPTQFP